MGRLVSPVFPEMSCPFYKFLVIDARTNSISGNRFFHPWRIANQQNGPKGPIGSPTTLQGTITYHILQQMATFESMIFPNFHVWWDMDILDLLLTCVNFCNAKAPPKYEGQNPHLPLPLVLPKLVVESWQLPRSLPSRHRRPGA